MKKIKVLSLVLLVVMVFLALTACGNSSKVSSASSFNNLYDSKFIPTDEIYDKADAITDAENSLCSKSSEEFAVFTSGAEGALKYKVYSFATGSVLKTFTSSVDEVFAVELCGDLPAFFVTKTKLATSVATYTLYDANGETLATSDENLGSPIVFDDTIIYGRTIYELDKKGNLVESEEVIPENIDVFVCDYWNDKYVYEMDTADGSFSLLVADRRFNPVSSWSAPSFAKNIEAFVLVNGNVFVQYIKELDANVAEYDFFEYTEEGNVQKFDLVTLVINAKNGTEKSIDADYVVSGIISYNEIAHSTALADVYNDGMGNLAFITRIVDGQIDNSDASLDIVLLNNDCTSAKSLKIVDQQTASLPTKLGKNVFMVATDYGYAIVKANGNLIHAITNSDISANAEYVIGEKAIYEMSSFEVVYDLEENEAEVISSMNSVVFIVKDGDILMLRDGEVTEIGKAPSDLLPEAYFATVDGIGCYGIFDANSAEYTYYTLDGTELMKSKYKLTIAASSTKYDTLIVCGLNSGLGLDYNALTKAEEK